MLDAHIKKRSPDAFPCRNVQESASFFALCQGGRYYFILLSGKYR